MKKIIFIILALIVFVNVTKAEILQEETGNWQEEKIEGNNVEVQYRYRFYRDSEFGDYIRLGESSNYDYEDKNNIMYGNYSDYMESCEEKIGYEIENAIEYQYQELLPIQFVKIVNTSNEILKIKEMEINNFDTVVDYEFYIGVDGTKKDLTIKPNGYIIFWMSYSVSLRQFTLNLELENKDVSYEVIFSNGKYFPEDKLVAKVSGNSNRIVYKYDDTFTLYNNYTPVFTSYNIKVDDFTKVISEKNVCTEREIMTYRYNIEKEYYDDNYYTEVEELPYLDEEERKEFKKDENDYKIFYRYTNNSNTVNGSNNINKDENSDEDVNHEEDIDYDNINEDSNKLIQDDNVPDDDNLNENNNEGAEDVLKDNDTNNNIINDDNKELNNNDIQEEKENNNIKLVKTGVDKPLNYNYLILYVLTLLLISLILIKHIKKMSNKNNI